MVGKKEHSLSEMFREGFPKEWYVSWIQPGGKDT